MVRDAKEPEVTSPRQPSPSARSLGPSLLESAQSSQSSSVLSSPDKLETVPLLQQAELQTRPAAHKARLVTAVVVFAWFCSNIGLLLMNKYLLSNYGFKQPVFLTLCHMLACVILSTAFSTSKHVPKKSIHSNKQLLKISLLAIVFAMSVLLGNVSLRFIPVSFSQVLLSVLYACALCCKDSLAVNQPVNNTLCTCLQVALFLLWQCSFNVTAIHNFQKGLEILIYYLPGQEHRWFYSKDSTYVLNYKPCAAGSWRNNACFHSSSEPCYAELTGISTDICSFAASCDWHCHSHGGRTLLQPGWLCSCSNGNCSQGIQVCSAGQPPLYFPLTFSSSPTIETLDTLDVSMPALESEQHIILRSSTMYEILKLSGDNAPFMHEMCMHTPAIQYHATCRASCLQIQVRSWIL